MANPTEIRADQIDTGTGPNQIVQLDGTSKLPAVDGSQLTNLPGGGALTVTTVNFAASPYAVLATDEWIIVDASGGVVQLDLHAVSVPRNFVLYITKKDGSANAVTVNPNGAETIIGVAGPQLITVQYQNLTLMHDGTEWFIL